MFIILFKINNDVEYKYIIFVKFCKTYYKKLHNNVKIFKSTPDIGLQ
jgi:hypothetical protein